MGLLDTVAARVAGAEVRLRVSLALLGGYTVPAGRLPARVDVFLDVFMGGLESVHRRSTIVQQELLTRSSKTKFRYRGTLCAFP
jgi:hypothetical protein